MSTDKPLLALVREHLSGDMSELPLFHSVAIRLQQTLARQEFSIEEVLELICEDQSLAGKVLRVANSSFYAGLSKVATIKEAIIRLGAQEIANVAMIASQLECYKSSNKILNTYMQVLWTHTISCAVGAKWIAHKAGYSDISSQAFMGGLLHDIGKLALLKVLDDIIRSGEISISLTNPLIDEILTTMHEEVGYNLMRSWSLPETYATIAIQHHNADFDTGNILLAVVRIANEACRKVGKDIKEHSEISLISCSEAQILGMKEISLAELEIVVEDACEFVEM
jgi:putative nucleotidyltransferase with HDIG domain